jgi:hypothetical protein
MTPNGERTRRGTRIKSSQYKYYDRNKIKTDDAKSNLCNTTDAKSKL